VKYLYEVCKCDPKDHSAFQLASENGHLDVMKYLYEVCKCDPSADNFDTYDDDDEESAIQLALFNGHFEVVQFLCEVCKIDLKNEYQTLIQKAYEEYQFEIARYLKSLRYDS
jgi:ankyrin repeat protein